MIESARRRSASVPLSIFGGPPIPAEPAEVPQGQASRPKITVAVLDTGLDYDRDDSSGAITLHPDFVAVYSGSDSGEPILLAAAGHLGDQPKAASIYLAASSLPGDAVLDRVFHDRLQHQWWHSKRRKSCRNVDRDAEALLEARALDIEIRLDDLYLASKRREFPL